MNQTFGPLHRQFSMSIRCNANNQFTGGNANIFPSYNNLFKPLKKEYGT
jgi:hypothetical protein